MSYTQVHHYQPILAIGEYIHVMSKNQTWNTNIEVIFHDDADNDGDGDDDVPRIKRNNTA